MLMTEHAVNLLLGMSPVTKSNGLTDRRSPAELNQDEKRNGQQCNQKNQSDSAPHSSPRLWS